MKTVIMFLSLIFTQLVFAHADHPPRIASCAPAGCTQAEVDSSVPLALEFLANTGRIEKSWINKKIGKAEFKPFAKGSEWVVKVTDSKAKKGKQDLFIFITTDGILNGSNFSGN